ncbi:MAG: tryptophan--tRNA ligase, partial [Pseudomonadota bacterium]
MRILSGVQPSGNLHLGNYLGAIRNWVRMQDKAECLFCIVDLHALTQNVAPAALTAATRETYAAYVACGIDDRAGAVFH